MAENEPLPSEDGARALDPDASPFPARAIEGLPYETGSEEDLAIQRVLHGAPGE